jgi:hypothetical protein
LLLRTRYDFRKIISPCHCKIDGFQLQVKQIMLGVRE